MCVIRCCPPACPKTRPMKNDPILSQIAEYCRQADMAETTFGRRAVNDGKLVHRLREGKRITIDTLDRIQAYIAASMPGEAPPPRGLEVPPEKRDPRGNFRLFENRQKCLLFAHTCSEKRAIAERAVARCWRGRCGRCTAASPICRSILPARSSALRMSGCPWTRCRTGCSS